MRRILISLTVCWLLSFSLTAQTASINTGCVPLVVSFNAPSAGSYYWDFGDATSSILQNPEHTFTDPGQFEVELRDAQGGTIVGTLSITVYPDPVLDVDPSIVSGCAPLTVDFNSILQLDPALTIEDILWSFGDGNISDAIDPTHTYTSSGTFTVSVQITTNETECDKTELFSDLITVTSVGDVDFSINLNGACSAPATVQINNNSTQSSDLSYAWDFGNNTNGTGYNPGAQTYTADGAYTITLSVSDNFGCTETFTQSFTIGLPSFDLFIPDTVCLNTPIPITNNTPTSFFLWQFGPDASIPNSAQREPNVSFSTPGFQTIQVSAFDDPSCQSDTSFQVFVEEVNVNFTTTPTEGCQNPMPIQLSADNPNFAEYNWNDGTLGGPVFDLEIVCPVRDSLHINLPEIFPYQLDITSYAGCTATAYDTFTLRKPYAHFLPSITSGCAPLEVEFTDESLSLNGFDNLYWTLGDGTAITNETEITHIYDQPGEYYVQLIAETAEGCRDTSAGRWILVGEQIVPEYTISNLDICLHDTIEITLDNNDPRIDGWHVYTDDSRTSHCFIENSMSHQFSTQPGLYDVEFSINYNGCFTEVTAQEQINVRGANSDISYMINCETPYDIMLKNDGLNANMVTWQIDSMQISSLDSLMYTFPDRGDYLLTLITEDTNSGCPADTSEVTIFIREPVASFEIPERVCDNISYTLDASASIDVDNDCSQGYLWKLPFSRPREVDVTSIDHSFPVAGVHEVELIVEDMHGCRDTLKKTTESYGIYADILVDTDRTCLPDSVTYTNLSTSDTTLVVTDWSFGSSDSVAIAYHEFTNEDEIIVQLTLEDALGCEESISHVLEIYNPTSNLLISQGPEICEGESITFSATDFTSEGSFLNFQWDFGTLGTQEGQTITITFDQPGNYPVELYYEEAASGCSGILTETIEVVPFPVANFVSSLDGVNPICYPAQIELTNTSSSSGPVETEWYIDGQGPFSGDMPTFAFDKGTHEVMLVVSSIYGCADTTMSSYTLVGPEGNFTIDPAEICIGDEVTFTLFDTVDVNGWEWDFGDGTILESGNPVTHTYTFKPNTGNTNISLTLFSEETGCEVIETIPVVIEGPDALFEKIDSLEYCDGVAFFNNLSTDANEYTWLSSGEQISTDFEPRIDFGTSGTFDITLIASVAGSNCRSEYAEQITLDPVPEFIQIPNVFTPNGDGNNDFFNLVVTELGFEEFVEVVTFKIYDRWGQLVYDNENPLLGWDGQFKATEAPTEVYAYYIEYEIIDCNNKAMKGNVTIVR